MTLLIRLWPLWLALLTGVCGWLGGWEWRDRSADIQDLRTANAGLAAQVAEANKTLETERQKAQALAAIAQQYEQDKTDALDREARLRADLAAGTVKLRREWQGCETSRLSDAATATRELDAAAVVRERLAAEIVRLGADADAQVRGLQAVIVADRAGE